MPCGFDSRRPHHSDQPSIVAPLQTGDESSLASKVCQLRRGASHKPTVSGDVSEPLRSWCTVKRKENNPVP